MSDAILPMPPFAWQQSHWNDFVLRVRNNSIPHAFLLASQEGFGAESMAIAMGQYLLCMSPTDEIVCGRCKACMLLNAGTHPDLKSVTPESAGKQIKVDQVREISGFVSKTAQQGGRKVIVLYPAEAMNLNAANALLKNLEEPSGETIFILVSNEQSRLLPTIRSRCAKVSMPVPDQVLALDWVKGLNIENASELLLEAGGAPLLVKDWHEQGILQERSSLISALADLGLGRLEPMNFAKKWSNKDPLFVIQIMMHAVDSILSKALGRQSCPKAYDLLVKSMESSSHKHLFLFRDRLCSKKAQLLGPSNLNPALVIEELTLDWMGLTKSLK